MTNEKVCKTCSPTIPIPLDRFGASAAGKYGVKAHCKKCMSDIEMDRWHRKNPTSTGGITKATKERDRFNALILKCFPRAHAI